MLILLLLANLLQNRTTSVCINVETQNASKSEEVFCITFSDTLTKVTTYTTGGFDGLSW